MKKYLVLLVILGFSNLLFSQVDLETVWSKETTIQINFAKFSADGNFIYCVIGKTIQKMEAKTGDFVSMFDNTNVIAISDMAISNDGKIIMTNAAYQGLNIWDVQNEKVIKYIPYEKTSGMDGVLAADLSGDGQYIVAWVTEYIDFNKINGYLILYDLSTNTEIKRISYAQGTIRHIKISHDGKYFVTGSYYQDSFTKKFGNLLILWDTETLTPIDTLENKEDDDNDPGYRLIKFSRDDKYLGAITNGYNGPFIYDLITSILVKKEDFRSCKTFDFLADSLHYVAAFGEFGTEMYQLSNNSKIRLYNKILSSIIESCKSSENENLVFIYGDTLRLLKEITTDVSTPNGAIKNIDIHSDNGKVIIETNGFYQNELFVTISDLIGKRIYEERIYNLNNQNRFELRTVLPAGLYICKIVAGTKEYSQKFEIVR